jgi:hypothetical protein
MNALKKYLIIFLFITPALSSSYGQYIKLVGRQFKDGNGNDFYPIICNYSCQLAHSVEFIEDLSASYVTPIKDYGIGYGNPSPNKNFEHNDQEGCREQMNLDFQKIVGMGFNTIRIMGLPPIKILDNYPNPGFYIESEYNDFRDVWKGISLSILPPYCPPPPGENVLLQQLFNFWNIVLDVAEQNGLKVIFVVGWGDIAALNEYLDFADYLTAVAKRFRNNLTLLAYEVMQEPTGVLNYNPYGYSKSDVCMITTAWYDSIKYHDPNHLITLGASLYELWEWDPGIMKIDFFSAHIYPDIQKEFEDSTDFYNTCRLKRVLGVMAWLDSECPIPWLIGETGYSAQDDYYYGEHNWVPEPVYYPNVNGNLMQQRKYADITLQYVRNCHGSGYAWWNYQENWWSISQDGYGLLRHGGISDPIIEKNVVDVFRNYPNPPQLPQSYTLPDTYLFPYECATGTMFFPTTGLVLDQDSIPIINALIKGEHWPKDPSTKPLSLYGFSEGENGNFELSIPFNDLNNKYNRLSVTAVGASVIKESAPFHQQFILTRRLMNYSKTISGVNVELNENKIYKAWSTLNLIDIGIKGNGILGGNAEFVARDLVHVLPSFNAEKGCYVHLYNDHTFQDCGNIPFFPERSIIPFSPYDKTHEKFIEVTFSLIASYYKITPNPSDGIFYIRRSNPDDNEQQILYVEVYSLMGQLVHSSEFSELPQRLDLSNLQQGVYFITMNDGKQVVTHKIIIL